MPLRREATNPATGASAWAKQHAAGLVCAGLGLAAVGIAAMLSFGGDETVRIPDVRVTAPLLVATFAAALVAIVRREGTYSLILGGVTLAGAAMVLGWAIVVGVIVAISALIIMIMHHLM